MDTSAIITSQYLAALEMLKAVVVKCPDPLWSSPEDKTPVWHIAYHTLFYTHLYLQDSVQAFTPWARHRPDSQQIGQAPGEPYERAAVLEYLAFCQQEVRARVPLLDLAAPSGFDWLPFDKLELQFYTIRHLQQHVGELMERLGTRANLEFDWVGRAAVTGADRG